jgi:hypothetical protein
MLLLCICSYLKSVLRYKFINFGYLSSKHCIYIRKDVRIHGYFSKPIGVHKQKSLGNTVVVEYLPLSLEGLCVKVCDELPLSACAGQHEDAPAYLAA